MVCTCSKLCEILPLPCVTTQTKPKPGTTPSLYWPGCAVEADPLHAGDLQAIPAGGLENLTARHMDVCSLDLPDNSFGVVTVLEVLEHLPDPAAAARETIRVAANWVVASVPSKADDNPQHIQLFGKDDLEQLFLEAGAVTVQVEHVLNHRIILARAGG